MATSHGIVHKASRSTIGTLDYTQTGLGTPKGLIFLGSQNVSVNVDFADLGHTVGVSDFSGNGQMMGGNYEDDVSVTDCKKLNDSNNIYGADDAGTYAPDNEANFDSLVTDGIRLNWPTLASTARRTSALLLKEGIDQFHTQHKVMNATGVTTITVGFTPDVILAYGVGTSIEPDSNGYQMVMGMYHRADDVYASIGTRADNGETDPDSADSFVNDYIVGTVNVSTHNWFNEFTLGNFTSTGFDATKVSSVAVVDVVWVAIKFANGYSGKVGNFSAPVTNGVASVISELPFTPQFGILAATGVNTLDDTRTDGCTFSYGACCFDNADAKVQVSQGGYIDDFGFTANSECQGFHREDSCIYLKNSAAIIRVKALFDAFPSGGLDLDFTVTHANWDVTVGYFVFGPDNVTSPFLPYFTGSQKSYLRR